jgi:hypothetical protein
MTGLEANDPCELEERLAVAVGATGSRELRSRLRARSEGALCELLEPIDDPELDEALKRLKAIL